MQEYVDSDDEEDMDLPGAVPTRKGHVDCWALGIFPRHGSQRIIIDSMNDSFIGRGLSPRFEHCEDSYKVVYPWLPVCSCDIC